MLTELAPPRNTGRRREFEVADSDRCRAICLSAIIRAQPEREGHQAGGPRSILMLRNGLRVLVGKNFRGQMKEAGWLGG